MTTLAKNLSAFIDSLSKMSIRDLNEAENTHVVAGDTPEEEAVVFTVTKMLATQEIRRRRATIKIDMTIDSIHNWLTIDLCGDCLRDHLLAVLSPRKVRAVLDPNHDVHNAIMDAVIEVLEYAIDTKAADEEATL